MNAIDSNKLIHNTIEQAHASLVVLPSGKSGEVEMLRSPSDSRSARAHRRALRAAATVSFSVLSLALGGCAAAVTPAETTTEADGSALPDVAANDAYDAHDGGSLRDSAPDARCDQREENYLQCCESVNWDPRQGCLAWGPFTPPAEEA